ncbi:ABC transporter family substrate-binding protein [Nocardia yamanashiensis]|uniref:ABC transporter family substrate-binding protein n=1 Tax=Nocardia yamanashiensis TaxID=209247 RepID=UPI001E45A5DC|nr:ABC transporter family substrate-binding protein [Nocardia yamanashiensis]UGT40393.1 ABC transporter family substrate-binding protein [Nocardia yamanashiensis]
MRKRSTGMRLAIPLVAVALAVAGCGGDDSSAPAGSAASLGTTNDINPHDVADLRDGGNLRVALTALPQNWNGMQNDGNDVDTGALLKATMPRAFKIDAAGVPTVNTDYFTSVELTNTNPQQVTYTINPKAVWSDGNPITWEDIAAEAQALNGKNKEFLIASSNGFDRVEKVERGVDDRQAVLTFNKHFSDWKGQFAGNSFLFPKSVSANPEVFNKGYVNDPTPSAGPFIVKTIDRAQNRVILGRNPNWWGATPKLDTITYSVLDSAAQVPALQNNEIDAVGIGNRDELKTAKSTPGVVIRRAPGMSWSHLTFNGAPGSILSDPAVRVAIMKGIDRQGIVTAIQNGLVENPKPLQNHIYMAGQKGYEDNSFAFDSQAAAKALDDAGWKLNGDVREKDGRKLVVRNIMYNDPNWVQIAQIIQQNLAQIGVKTEIVTKPGKGYFTDVIQPGDFDMAFWGWLGDPFPFGSLTQIWGYDPNDLQGNYGRVGSPEVNAKIEETISELDSEKAVKLANELDKMIWAEGHSTPLFQSPGNVAVRDNLANYGAVGMASVDYTKIGFLK